MTMLRTGRKLLLIVFAILPAFAPALCAQQAPLESSQPAIPVITGVLSFQSTFAPGTQTITPEFDPLLLVPFGSKLLLEAEYSMFLNLTRDQGRWGPSVVNHGVEYLQLNYVVHPNLTIVVGRFLTPFGIYRERLHPLWIRNLQDEPIIFAMNNNSSNGAMLRGAVRLTSRMNITYASYYSAPTSDSQFAADRRAGGRASLLFPNQRFEAGVSYSRVLDRRYNMLGADLTWNLKKIPLNVRAELLHSAVLGRGYWVEGAYRLNKLAANAFVHNSEIVARAEQYHVPKSAQSLLRDLPAQNTTRAALGWNYYLRNGVRFNASYGRNFASGADHYSVTLGITYRFLLF